MAKTEWLLASPATPTNSRADTPLFPFLEKFVRGEDLSMEGAGEFFRQLTDINANQAQIAGCLVALTSKGETPQELAGMARAMRNQSVRIRGRSKGLVDVAGTGSSPAKTFNVSTAAAFVAAGAGVHVAKHGNRGITSNSGSADVLSKLGVKVSSEPSVAQTSLDGAGICFMFAPKFHPTMQKVGDVRRALGMRTFLNLLGVLSNPANACGQVVGVWHRSLVQPMAQALALLGIGHAWVVHGRDGLDEITVDGETLVAEVVAGKIRQFAVSPKNFGLHEGPTEHVRAATPDESAKIIKEVLASRRRDEARSLVVMNAAAALIVGGVSKDPVHAARLAEQSIDSGQAQNKLERLVMTTNKR